MLNEYLTNDNENMTIFQYIYINIHNTDNTMRINIK